MEQEGDRGHSCVWDLRAKAQKCEVGYPWDPVMPGGGLDCLLGTRESWGTVEQACSVLGRWICHFSWCSWGKAERAASLPFSLPSQAVALVPASGGQSSSQRVRGADPHSHTQGLGRGESFLFPSFSVCACVWLCPPLCQLSLCDCLAWRLSVFLGQSVRSLVSQAVPVSFCIPLK